MYAASSTGSDYVEIGMSDRYTDFGGNGYQEKCIGYFPVVEGANSAYYVSPIINSTRSKFDVTKEKFNSELPPIPEEKGEKKMRKRCQCKVLRGDRKGKRCKNYAIVVEGEPPMCPSHQRSRAAPKKELKPLKRCLAQNCEEKQCRKDFRGDHWLCSSHRKMVVPYHPGASTYCMGESNGEQCRKLVRYNPNSGEPRSSGEPRCLHHRE